MSEKSNNSAEVKKMASAYPANVRARDMLLGVCGPRDWNDTRESWLARDARRVGLTVRRARAIFYQEPIRLSADEYLAIEVAHEAAHASVAALSTLASHADLRAREAHALALGGTDREGRQADRQERPASDAAFRP